MMQEQSHGSICQTVTRTVGLLLCFFILTGCGEEKPRLLTSQAQDFIFQPQANMTPETVLQSLQPTHGRPSETLNSYRSPILWRQEQFSEVAKKLVANEIEQGARITLVGFSVLCRDTDFGPQSMGFHFHRVGTYEGQQTKFDTITIVDAQNGYLGSMLSAYVPPSAPESTIDQLEAKIPAEKILPIAEEMGGQKYRELISNECNIEGILTENRWQIIYKPSVKPTAHLSLFFDATTGALLETQLPPSTVIPQK